MYVAWYIIIVSLLVSCQASESLPDPPASPSPSLAMSSWATTAVSASARLSMTRSSSSTSECPSVSIGCSPCLFFTLWACLSS